MEKLFEVRDTMNADPKIKLIGVDKGYEQEEIMHLIMEQNKVQVYI